jgi:hypothetical protein
MNGKGVWAAAIPDNSSPEPITPNATTRPCRPVKSLANRNHN